MENKTVRLNKEEFVVMVILLLKVEKAIRRVEERQREKTFPDYMRN